MVAPPFRLDPRRTPGKFSAYSPAGNLVSTKPRRAVLPAAAAGEPAAGGGGGALWRRSLLALPERSPPDNEEALVLLGADDAVEVNCAQGSATQLRLSDAAAESVEPAVGRGQVDAAARLSGAAVVGLAAGSLLLRRGRKLLLVRTQQAAEGHAAASTISELCSLPLGEELGDVLAACALTKEGGDASVLRILFSRCVQTVTAAGPKARYLLTLCELRCGARLPHEAGSTAAFAVLLRLSGGAPPLAASASGARMLILANGAFEEVESASAAAAGGRTSAETTDGGDVVADNLGPDEVEGEGDFDGGEADGELDELLRLRGFNPEKCELTSGDGASPASIALGHMHAAVLTGISACEGSSELVSLRLPRPALDATCCGPAPTATAEPALRAVLRTPDGHAALVHCTWGEEDAGPCCTHVDTFAGLGLLCDTPGFARLYLSLDGDLAAVARWRGRPQVELYKHPRGATASTTQGLQLEKVDEPILGVHLSERAVIIWHASGVDCFARNLPDCTQEGAALVTVSDGDACNRCCEDEEEEEDPWASGAPSAPSGADGTWAEVDEMGSPATSGPPAPPSEAEGAWA